MRPIASGLIPRLLPGGRLLVPLGLLAGFVLLAALPARAIAPTAPRPQATPGVSAVALAATPTSAAYGSLFTLVATVTDPKGNAATAGSVTFFDGATALGTVQVVGNDSAGGTVGTATLKTILVPLGVNIITAKYSIGTAKAQSTPVPVTVTGTYPSSVTLTSTGSAGSYALTGTVTGPGPFLPTGPVAPKGNILFTDTTTGLTPGTAPIGPGSVAETFVAAPNATGVTAPFLVAFADLNGDGIPDLVTGNSTGLFVELGNGDGTFQLPYQIETGGVSDYAATGRLRDSNLVFGDFNGDGNLDIAMVECSGSTSPCSVLILLGNGDGTFHHGAHLDQTADIGNIAVGDFNGDGILDLAVANVTSQNVDMLLGNGDGTFQKPALIGATGVFWVAAGDLNGDGKTDLVYFSSSDGHADVLLGNGDGTFQAAASYSLVPGGGGADVALADLQGNGTLDILAMTCGYSCYTQLKVLLGNGDGTFQSVMSGDVPLGSSLGFVVADVNGDGQPDLVGGDRLENSVDVMLGNGDGTFQSAVTYPTGAGPKGVAVADQNHAGRPGIAVANNTDNTATILLNQVTKSATLSNVALPGSGTHTLTAAYSGDKNFGEGTSNSIQLAASLVTPIMTLAGPPGSIIPPGQALSVSVTMTGPATFIPTPTGSIGYSVDGGKAQTSTLGAGAVTVYIGQLSTGSHNVAVTYSGDNYYTPLKAQTLKVTVAPSTQTITFAPLPNVTYGVTPFTLSASDNCGLPITFSIASGPATVLGNTLTVTGAGTVVVAANQAGNASCNAAPTVTQSFKAAQAPLTVTVNSATKVYGAALPVFGGTIKGVVNGDKIGVTYSSAATIASPAGSYPIAAALSGTALPNYAPAVTPGTLTVTKALLTITAGNANSVYGSALPAFTYTPTGLVNGDSAAKAFTGAPSLTTGATAKSPVGGYAINAAAGTMASANYSFKFAPGTLTIGKAALTVTADNLSAIFGAALPKLTYKIGGFVNGDTQAVVTGAPALTTPASQGSTAAAYPILVKQGTLAASNYSFTPVNGTLTIGKATPSITWPTPAPFKYGTPLGTTQMDATASVPGKFAYSAPAGTVPPAGAYTLGTTFTPTDATDYTTVVASVKLTVTPALLTVNAASVSRPYGKPNPAFPFSFAGFVNGDTANAVTGKPALTTTATQTSPVGFYTIAAAQGTLAAQNYNFTFVGGTLTVTQAIPACTWPTPAPITYPTPLSTTQLDANCGVAGSYLYSPQIGTVPAPGAQRISLTFIPIDRTDYTTSTASVTLTVNKGAASIQLSASATSVAAGAPVTFTATLTGGGAVPSGTAAFLDGASQMGAATLNSGGAAAFTTSKLAAGKHTVTASYGGDGNYAAVASTAVTVTVTK